ncbi:MAG: ABC transporter ATP-binding protein [Alphaproteobacteria bacterium]|nr:ABC transporter ATP-binding protein [Alphaproteobacteria bacterium]
MSEVVLDGLVKRYGLSAAVDGVSLSIAKGELVALLGPSGCGKTTSLRMIAGFVVPDAGTIRIAGRDVTRELPHRRDAGMVFQSYALFPHLTVAENIGFGLKRRGVARHEIAAKVGRMIAMLRLDGLADRLPRQLSGGQQQRVAVGRALVIEPKVVLLDEPFSNLDAQLRETTRIELRRLQQELRLTAIFVTHDQTEAMAIADRIAVMNKGRIEQIDAPAALYARPRTRFVAGFMGRANVFDVEPGADGTWHGGHDLVFRSRDAASGPMAAVLRPESVALDTGAPSAANAVVARVELVSFLGSTAQLALRTESGTALLVEGVNALATQFPLGSRVTARWSDDAVILVPS